MIELPVDFSACERGNTWLISEDGQHLAFIDVPDSKRRLSISIFPENYPGLNIQLLSEEDSTDEAIAKRINLNYVGWHIRKCNVNGVLQRDAEVIYVRMFEKKAVEAVESEDEARELAINWQQWQSNESLSLGEVAEYMDYFTQLADKFPGLKDEFTENAII